jgi:hypothetical protein
MSVKVDGCVLVGLKNVKKKKKKAEKKSNESGAEWNTAGSFRPLQRQYAGMIQRETWAGSPPAGQAAGLVSRVR